MTTPENTIANLKTWLEQAQTWLHQDGSPDPLQPPHRQLLKMMACARDEDHASEVWKIIDEIENLAVRMNDIREQGEVFVWCATMAADLENLKDALRLFQAAESKYKSYPHQHAVALWMLGCLHWYSHQKVEGILTWQEAISLFKDRQLSVQVDAQKAKWYVEKLPQLVKYLEDAIRTDGLPPYVLNASITPDPPTEAKTDSTDSSEETDALRWLSCPVSESVPAGGFGPAGYDPEPLGFLEFSEVVIENEPYLVHSIRRPSRQRNTVNMGKSMYMTIHVDGTSMNAAKPVPINDGDYVLVRGQSTAEDNDIVVAGIFGQNERATIKRIRRQNGKIRLIPESYDPNHYELDWEKEFNELDEGFKIIGVVDAVFKKKQG